MTFITTDNLNSIMAEMTDFCNAACPMCNRYDWNLKLVKEVTNQHHTTLKLIKEKIGDSIISKLETWICQGTYGDASMNPETIEIFKYLKSINPTIKIIMNTNGGARDTNFWKTLANLDVKINFAIDGLEDTNHLYRRNVKWNNLMNNVKSFIENNGRATWFFLIFKHNEHQIEQAKTLAKKLNFKAFESSYSERWQDFNDKGEYRDVSSIKIDNYFIEKPSLQNNNWTKSLGNTSGTLNKNNFQKENKNNFFTKKISCWACSPVKREIYLRANGYVSPCCFLGDVERNEPKKLIKDYKKINLNYTDLKTILNGEFFKDLEEGINGGPKRLQGCFHTCGVN